MAPNKVNLGTHSRGKISMNMIIEHAAFTFMKHIILLKDCLDPRFVNFCILCFIFPIYLLYIVHFSAISCTSSFIDATNIKKCLNHLKSGPGRSEGEPIFHPDDFSEGI